MGQTGFFILTEAGSKTASVNAMSNRDVETASVVKNTLVNVFLPASNFFL